MAGGLVGASLLGLVPAVRGATKRLRPPGALLEEDFLAACIKCGQCVQVCPVEAIHLADINVGAGMGTPIITARDQACDFSCDGLQCVLACPTGALTHHINYPHEARMGVAKMVHPDKCLAAQGLGFQGLARNSTKMSATCACSVVPSKFAWRSARRETRRRAILCSARPLPPFN